MTGVTVALAAFVAAASLTSGSAVLDEAMAACDRHRSGGAYADGYGGCRRVERLWNEAAESYARLQASERLGAQAYAGGEPPGSRDGFKIGRALGY